MFDEHREHDSLVMESTLTPAVLRLASGSIERVTGSADDGLEERAPKVTFDWEGGVGEFACDRVTDLGERRRAENMFLGAFRYLNAQLFRERVVPSASNPYILRIREAQLGKIGDPDSMLSASSPGALGVIRLAANWYEVDLRRAAGVILHESVHQLLYGREYGESPVRFGSIGYSPWKRRERPGRLVWHAFWTFAVQLGFLVDTVGNMRGCKMDGSSQIVEMLAHLESCHCSLRIFEIVQAEEELARIEAALHRISQVISAMPLGEGGADRIRLAREHARSEFNGWAARLLGQSRMV